MMTRGQVSNGEAVKGDKVTVMIDGQPQWLGRIEYFRGPWVGIRQGQRVDELMPELVVRN